MFTLTYILVIITVILCVSMILKNEPFTSPGTMDQLSSTHVDTEEDNLYYRFMYPKIVRKEIANMTGDDPGPLFPTRF
jgi:hypothetical protein